MDFLKNYNRDNIFFRELLIGLISKLNEHITYPQVDKDGNWTNIHIPFLPTLVGDEPFLQDNFLDYGDCDGNPAFAEGNYDVVPRGIVEEGACQIVTSSSTNKFVRASFTREVPNINGDGGAEMKTFSAYLASIPVSQTYNVKIKLDTENEVFKVKARIVEVLFKNFVYYFQYNGIRIPCQATMPSNFGDTNKLFNYSYGSTTAGKDVSISFAIEVETYLPQLDPSTERFRGNLMQGGIMLKTTIGKTITEPDNTEIVKGIDVTSNLSNITFDANPTPGDGQINIT